MILISLLINSLNIFFYILPLFCLILSSFFFSIEATLGFSLSLLICQSISLIIQSLFIKSGLGGIWTILKFVLDISILYLSYLIYPYIPSVVIDFYYICLKWIFPLLVYTVEAYQGVSIIVYKTRSISSNIFSGTSSDHIFKFSILFISIFSYITSIYLVYEIFKYNEISTLNSCLLSSLGTLMILLIPYMITVEDSIVSDISLITLMVCLNLYSYFFNFNYDNIICTVNIFKSLSYLITLFLITYPILNKNNDDNNIENEDNDSILNKLKSTLINIGLVIGSTYLPLSIIGLVSNDNLLFRYIQGVFTVLLYFNLLSNSSNGFDDNSFKFKYD